MMSAPGMSQSTTLRTFDEVNKAYVDSVIFSNGKLANGTTYIPAGSSATPYWVVTESDVEIQNNDGINEEDNNPVNNPI